MPHAPKVVTAKTKRPGGAQLRLALIGSGRFAHLYHLPAILEDPRVKLVAICDPAPSPHTYKVANEHDIPITETLESTLKTYDCKGVIISTPHTLHAKQIRTALNAGKHILVDKPYVMQSADANTLTKLAARKNLLGLVAFNQRFSLAYLHARMLVASGQLGDLRRVESIQLGGAWVASADGNTPRERGPLRPAWYLDPKLAGGGVLVGRGAHMADAIPWVLGRHPSRVRGRVVTGRRSEVDGGGVADLDFGSFVWRLTTVADPGRLWDDVRLYGTEGTLEIRKPEGTLGYWDIDHHGLDGREIPTPPPGIDTVAVENFVDCLTGDSTPRCDFHDAYISVRILEAIYESSRKHGVWVNI